MTLPDLRTSRLLLRAWRPDDPSDLETALDIYRRDEVSKWLGAVPMPWPDLDYARARLERWASVPRETPGYGLWAVVPEGHDHPVGTVLLVHLPEADGVVTDDVEVGWHFHPDAWGHGYATEAADALLAHGFSTLGLATVNAVAHAGNAPSFAVMQRLGMVAHGPTDRWYGVTTQWWSIDAGDWADGRAVREREQALLSVEVRADRALVDELLHRDFVEHGSSGAVWVRDDVLENLPADPGIPGTAYGFRASRLGPDAMLLTYRIDGERPSLRSSVWLRDDDGAWRVRFHQGTRLPAPEGVSST